MTRGLMMTAIAVLSLTACDRQSATTGPSAGTEVSVATTEAVSLDAEAEALSPEVEAVITSPVSVRADQDPIQLPMVLEGKALGRSLSQGFMATWGRVPPISLDRPSGRVTFRNGDFAYLGDGRVLFAAYGDAAAAGGKGVIALRYLTRGPDALEAGPGEILFVEGGLGTAGQAEWIIRHDLMSDPVMMIENAGPWGDYSCIGADLIALTASGPVRLLPGDRRVRPLPNPDNLPLC